MKFSYFTMIEDKYSSMISLNKPIVIRLDGKEVTKSKNIQLFNDSVGGFANSIKLTAKEISILYNTLVFVSTDELNLIFIDTNIFYNKFKSCKCQKSSSLIAQDVSLLFNNFYDGNIIYFDARTFNIPNDKISSYLKFRKSNAKNVGITYVSKRVFPYHVRKNKKSTQLLDLLKLNFPNDLYEDKYFNQGEAYYKGRKIDIEKLLLLEEFNNFTLTECYIENNFDLDTLNSIFRIDDIDGIDDI